MIAKKLFSLCTTLLFLLATWAPTSPAQDWGHSIGSNGIRHVLLISIDGMHAVDYLNCSQGLPGVNNGESYCPNLAALGETGVSSEVEIPAVRRA